MTEQEALIVLNAVNGLGGCYIRKLVQQFGSAKRVLALSEADLASYNIIPSQVCRNILEFSTDKFLKSEYNLIALNNVKVVSYLDNDFPEPLKHIASAPAVLYIKGNLSNDLGASIAIVGSRLASIYGLTMARQFASRFAECGVTVVSGLARGIDSAAHQGCLDSCGETVAVLGCGLGHIYPPENEQLMAKIAETGAVVSEFSMDTRPLPINFPRRNRIISGLSMGILVVEAAQKSGALITVNYALEQGKDVYAIPGKVDNPAAKGTNELIKQGAKLVTCVEDVLDDLRPRLEEFVKADNRCENLMPKDLDLDANELMVMECVNQKPTDIETILQRIGCEYYKAAEILLRMELKKLIKQKPVNVYIKYDSRLTSKDL